VCGVYLNFNDLDQVVEQSGRGPSGQGRSGVHESVETSESEAGSVAPRSSVHVVAQGQNKFEQFPETSASLHLPGRVQDGAHPGRHLGHQRNKLLAEVQAAQPLLVMRNPEIDFLLIGEL